MSSSALAQAVVGAEEQGSVVAPEQAGNAGAPSGTGSQVEDIVVTAQRREQNLQRVPIAVSAFSANTIQNLRIENSTELLKFVPNVISFNNGGQAAQANYYFRGIGTPEGLQTFDPPVLTYVDEVPLGRIGKAEEFAAMATLLASEGGGYVTGAAINVDGGRSPVV